GFISQHFIYPLAYTGIDKRNNPRVGITAFKISVDDWFINRSYVTYGQVSEHIFFDNTWGTEFEFRFEMFGQTAHYVASLFFCDTEQSWTHHVSAGGSGQITQPLPISGVFLFAMASVTEKHLVSEMFTPVYSHFAGGFTVAFDGKSPDESRTYFGFGYSWAKPLIRYGTTPEQVIETFCRFSIRDRIQLTPDMQYIINPNGSEREDRDWLFIFGFRLHIIF
ncbi:MAG: carbohydrate porin, partial [Planctomycetes bacterium]|nr:carbohydrate porin [Planctomycetota bacterium]